ncbi:MAG: hypothetical protein WAM77_30160 [Xanthobacteraceae bacterium]
MDANEPQNGSVRGKNLDNWAAEQGGAGLQSARGNEETCTVLHGITWSECNVAAALLHLLIADVCPDRKRKRLISQLHFRKHVVSLETQHNRL